MLFLLKFFGWGVSRVRVLWGGGGGGGRWEHSKIDDNGLLLIKIEKIEVPNIANVDHYSLLCVGACTGRDDQLFDQSVRFAVPRNHRELPGEGECGRRDCGSRKHHFGRQPSRLAHT